MPELDDLAAARAILADPELRTDVVVLRCPYMGCPAERGAAPRLT